MGDLFVSSKACDDVSQVSPSPGPALAILMREAHILISDRSWRYYSCPNWVNTYLSGTRLAFFSHVAFLFQRLTALMPLPLGLRGKHISTLRSVSADELETLSTISLGLWLPSYRLSASQHFSLTTQTKYPSKAIISIIS